MFKPLKIAFIASEVAPFSKTGGLGDVARSLPKSLKRLGHDVAIITPLYGHIIDTEKNNLKLIFENIEININQGAKINVNFWKGELMDGLPVYFIENKKYFSKRKSLYGSNHENIRFLVFDLAALELLSRLEFKADIIHCHDWHTGLIPYFIKNTHKNLEIFQNTKTVFTIHNLVFQLGRNWWEIPLEKKDNGKKDCLSFDSAEFENINFTKRAILWADAVNTVSEQYREEIMTKNFGQDLHRILKNREDKLFGIINGIDYHIYNPENDPGLIKNYDYKKTYRKKTNKEFLQKIAGLPIDGNIPVIALTSRVTFQKGFKLIIDILELLTKQNIQIIIMGDGDKKYISQLKKHCKRHPEKIAWLPFTGNEDRETLIYAGSDFFLLPSHHEPCGINQLKAMRYGCVPIVRRVGGLHDTVENYSPKTNKGTGFSFYGFDTISLYGAIIRALENYHHKDTWNGIVARAMKQSNGWEIPAKKYIELFKKIIKSK